MISFFFFFSKLQVNTISEYTIHKRNNIDKNLSVVDIYYRLFRIQCMDFFFFAFVVMLFYKVDINTLLPYLFSFSCISDIGLEGIVYAAG